MVVGSASSAPLRPRRSSNLDSKRRATGGHTEATTWSQTGLIVHITFNRLPLRPSRSHRPKRRVQSGWRLRAFLVTSGRHRDHLGIIPGAARDRAVAAFLTRACERMRQLGVPAWELPGLRLKLLAGIRRHLGDDAVPDGLAPGAPGGTPPAKEAKRLMDRAATGGITRTGYRILTSGEQEER